MALLVVPGTAPDAVADAQALAALAGDGVLLAGDPVEAAAQAASGRTAIVRAATGAEAVPAAWAAALERLDAVWVPGEFARAALLRSGVAAERVHVVPPVVDVERFAPGDAIERPAGARSYVFLAVLDWTRAAGWDVLVRAWAEEFGADEDVTLVIRAWSSLGYTAPIVADALLGELDALGRDPGTLADLIVEVGPEHGAPEPAAYRGADCVVVPARADAWGRRTLEAMACGVPVIATDWGAGADVLAPGAALAVPASAADVPVAAARELPALAGARWGEPDLVALRAALRRAVSEPAAVAEIGARGRAHVLAHHARPVAVAPPRVGRRARRSTAAGARPEDVSFVLQGPVERAGRGRTARACAAIRAHFPGAEIVISTWEGTDTTGLDCDVVVCSEDPGVVGPNTYNVNTNRQIVSSLAGVRAAERPLVAKVRSDILFTSDVLLRQWGRWEERADELRLFDRRVLVPNIFARRPSYLSPYALHPSDWSYFGTREDLERLFDVPHMRRRDSTVKAPPTPLSRLYYGLPELPSYTPEQWIWTQALRKVAPDTALQHVFDLRPDTLRRTELSFANNFAILDTYVQYGIWCPKYAAPNRLFEDRTLFQHDQWLELYEVHCRDERSDAEDVLAALAERLDGATLADVARLRRSGRSWEAQLLECVLLGPRLRRDSTTGGAHRWHLDEAAVALARTELERCLDDYARARMKRRSRAATAA